MQSQSIICLPKTKQLTSNNRNLATVLSDASVAGPDKDAGDVGGVRQLPGESMLARSIADDQHLLGHAW